MSDNRKPDERPSHDFDPLEPETFTSAHERYKELRQQCPVAHSNEYGGFWALFNYKEVTDVLKDPSNYITSVQNVVPKVATTGRRPPLHLDPPEHTPYRRALDPFFAKDKMDEMEPNVRRIIVDLIQPLVERGRCDITEEYAQKLPGEVFAEFFNLSKEMSMEIKQITRVYNKALQEKNDDLVQKTSLELYDIARRIIDQRKKEPMDPKEDITTALLNTKHQGKPLPGELILGTIRQLIVVGMIAPSVFIGNMFVHLSEHQELQEQLRHDLSLVPAAIEEYLRLFTPYRGFARTSKKDVEIGGRTIKKDEPIALVYASANRDEKVFPKGDQFILHRPNIKQHIAFGMGPHQCPGAPLARIMLNITLEEMLKRTKRIELDGEIKMTRWPEWGTLSVPIKMEGK